MISKSKLHYFKALSQKKGRDKVGVFLVEGWRNVEEAMGAAGGIEILLYTKEAKGESRYSSLFSAALKRSREPLEVTAKEFGQIADTVTGQGIAAVVKRFSLDVESEIRRLLIKENAFVLGADHIADPGNLGAIIRTADWFGIDAIILSPGTVDLYNPKVVRSTAGSIFHLPIVSSIEAAGSFEQSLKDLQSGGFRLYGASVKGKGDLRSVKWPKKSFLVIGSEARGISEEAAALLDEHIAIPKFGKAESLNAGVAAGIFLSHASFQLRK